MSKQYRRLIITGIGDDVINQVNKLAEEGWIVAHVTAEYGREIYLMERDMTPVQEQQAPRVRATRPLKVETK
jgi:hypothetical protein